MTRVHVFCEGQTEEVFVREVLAPDLQERDLWLNPIVLATGPRAKGGVSSYGKVKRQILQKCREDRCSCITTLIDYYGLPADFPKSDSIPDSYDAATRCETAFQRDIGEPNFIANFVIHEFEGLLFSKPTVFTNWFDDNSVAPSIAAIRNSFQTPEHINDGVLTAPSKRILSICANYNKINHGSLLALDIGLDCIRFECSHFNAWLEKLEGLKSF